jgi:hypothetical protein
MQLAQREAANRTIKLADALGKGPSAELLSRWKPAGYGGTETK